MTYTYGGDPSTSSTAAIRFYISDTSSPWKFSDEEIAYVLTQYPSPLMAAAQCARKLAAKYAVMSGKKVGDLSMGQISQQYLDLATALEQKGAITGLAPYAGGISNAEKTAVDSDTDRAKPNFAIGQFDRSETRPGGTQSAPDEKFSATI
jgi:hypothetical protein